MKYKTQGKALSVFVPCNVDTPADASCGRYVPLSHEGVAKPWYEYVMGMDVGDMVVFTSELIHCGGAVPVGLPADTPRVIAFITLATICTTITLWRFPPHREPMPKRRYQHRRNVGVPDAARESHNPRPYAVCAKRSHYAKSMELLFALPAMQHLPPQHPNSLRRVPRIPPLVVYCTVLQHPRGQVLCELSPPHASCL